MKTCNYCGGQLSTWAQKHDMQDCAEHLRDENARLTAELAAARGHCNMTAAILSEFRFGNRIMRNCVSCDRETEWFRQMTDDGGINYCTVCGYSPEEQAEAIPF